MNTADVANMFKSEASEETLEATVSPLAEKVAIEMDALDKIEKDLVKRKEALRQAKIDLANLIRAAGLTGCKCSNGLNPTTKVVKKYYPENGLNSSEFHSWLWEQGLGSIIRLSVHFQTVQTTLAAWEDEHGDLPETVCKVATEPTIRMNGKSKFLASLNKGV